MLHKRGLPHTLTAARSIGLVPVPFMAKHKYAMPLDAEMRERIMPMARPYPKRAGGVDCTAGDQSEGGG